MKLIEAVVTFFGIGRIPVAAGTFGSLVALIPGVLIEHYFGSAILVVCIILLLGFGTAFVSLYIEQTGGDDPSEVVIDEVVGQWIALLAFPGSWLGILLAFVCFRFFDITKIWPVSFFDNKVAGAWGVMMDDVMAGIYPIAVIQIIAFASPHILPFFDMHFDILGYVRNL